jgi:hypothetical protein
MLGESDCAIAVPKPRDRTVAAASMRVFVVFMVNSCCL